METIDRVIVHIQFITIKYRKHHQSSQPTLRIIKSLIKF